MASDLCDVIGQEIDHKETAIKWCSKALGYGDRSGSSHRETSGEGHQPNAIRDSQLGNAGGRGAFNSACTTEIAVFNRFVDFMDKPEYDLMIFDTVHRT